jgi:hypothetical protein
MIPLAAIQDQSQTLQQNREKNHDSSSLTQEEAGLIVPRLSGNSLTNQ